MVSQVSQVSHCHCHCQVSRVALCMSKVKVRQWVSQWQGHLLSCSGQLKKLNFWENFLWSLWSPYYFLWTKCACVVIFVTKVAVESDFRDTSARGLWFSATKMHMCCHFWDNNCVFRISALNFSGFQVSVPDPPTITKCICSNYKMYLFKLQNVFFSSNYNIVFC